MVYVYRATHAKNPYPALIPIIDIFHYVMELLGGNVYRYCLNEQLNLNHDNMHPLTILREIFVLISPQHGCLDYNQILYDIASAHCGVAVNLTLLYSNFVKGKIHTSLDLQEMKYTNAVGIQLTSA